MRGAAAPRVFKLELLVLIILPLYLKGTNLQLDWHTAGGTTKLYQIGDSHKVPFIFVVIELEPLLE